MNTRSSTGARTRAGTGAAVSPAADRAPRRHRLPASALAALPVIALATGVATSVRADQDANTSPTVATTDAPPWSERAIGAHVDLAPLLAGAAPDGTLATDALAALVASGERLFSARFTTADGVGRPLATQAILPTKRRRAARTAFSRTAGMDANACASCHFQPLVGGAGDFSANVFVAEGFSQADFDTTDPRFSNERNTDHLFGAGLLELLAREMSSVTSSPTRRWPRSATSSYRSASSNATCS